MKRILFIATAIVLAVLMSFSAFADERKGQELEVKIYAESDGRYYFADTSDSQSDDIYVGETKNIAFSDFSEFKAISSGNENLKFGIMLVDDENGTGFVSYSLDDMKIKIGDSSYTISTKGDYSGNLTSGIYEDDTALIHEIDMSEKADILSNIAEISEISISLDYKSYDNIEPQPIESVPEEEEIPEEIPNPSTGIVSALMIPTLAFITANIFKRK